jgi:tetratricopeptide (TPR) repeat protein
MSKKSVNIKSKPAEKTRSANSYLFAAYAIAGLFTIIFLSYCLSNKFFQDDSYITFRYVKNFINGMGLVFNASEYVEGYTCFLWVLLLSIFGLIKLNIENTAQILSIIFGVLILAVTFGISSRINTVNPDVQNKSKNTNNTKVYSLLNIIPVLFLVYNGGFRFWTISGMETTMFVFFVLLGIYFYILESRNSVPGYKYHIYFLIASLTRPEGVFVYALVILHRILMEVKLQKSLIITFRIIFSKESLKGILIFIIPYILYFAFRYSYYGYILPNTFYAKTGFSSAYLNSGLEYFLKFNNSYLYYGAILALPLILFRRKDIFFETSLLYIIIIAYTLYIIFIGGDVLKQHRFFLTIAPLIFILFGKSLSELLNRSRSVLMLTNETLTVSLAVIISFVLSYYSYSKQSESLDKDIQSENGLVDKMRLAGNWFKQKQQQEGRQLTVAATTIGAISYFSDVTLVDMLGLTDKEIAHNPKTIPEISENENIGWKERNYNVDYIISRNPDYIYFSTGIKPSAYAERGLFTTASFRKNYYPYYFTLKEMNFQDVVYKKKKETDLKSGADSLIDNPNYKKSFINLFTQAINTSRDKSKTQEAMNLYKKCLEISPSDFSLPYQMLGDLSSQLGNKQEALLYYNKAVEISDHSIMAHYGLYQSYSSSGDTSQANKHIEKIKQYDPDLFGR